MFYLFAFGLRLLKIARGWGGDTFFGRVYTERKSFGKRDNQNNVGGRDNPENLYSQENQLPLEKVQLYNQQYTPTNGGLSRILGLEMGENNNKLIPFTRHAAYPTQPPTHCQGS